MAATAEPVADCPNCAVPAAGRYCAACGQEQGPLTHSMRDVARELVGELCSYDAKVWRTLVALVRHPGLLTADYLAGRRARYLRPLRLYLTVSLVYFLALGLRAEWRERRGEPTTTLRFNVTGPATAARPAPPIHPDSTGLEWQFKRMVDRSQTRLDAMTPTQRASYLASGIARQVPNAMFVLMPLFALFLRALYARSGRGYVDHFIFTLHVHAFAFAASTAFLVVPVGTVRAAIVAWVPVYLVLALRRVYAQSRRRTAFRYAALVALYLPSLVATLVALTFAVFLAAR